MPSFRLLLIADFTSTHTQKWTLSLAGKGIEMAVFSMSAVDEKYLNISTVRFFGNMPRNKYYRKDYRWRLMGSLPELRKAIKAFKPHIVHAHYATSNGLLGALSGFHPFILSVWGSDVFDFPQKSPLHKALLKFNLRKADRICSTGKIMAKETALYTDKEISVVPFGVNLNAFKPFYSPSGFPEGTIVMGSVKAIEKIYGHQYLIEAFRLIKSRIQNIPLKLVLVGDGAFRKTLRKKVTDYGLEKDIIFKGFIDPCQIPENENKFTIAVFPSLRESFGVSALEASACEKPVVATNVGGHAEVVEDGVTGILVPPVDAVALADALEKLIKDENLRLRLGKQGRERVEKYYNWDKNVDEMISIYEKVRI